MENQKFNKPTRGYAMLTSFLLSAFLTLILFCLLFLFQEVNFWVIGIFFIYSITITFLLLRFRIKKYIDGKITTIFNELESLDQKKVLESKTINTDMDALLNQVKTYAENRKTEIEVLKGKEQYRKEFLGNVSHELKTPLFTIQGYVLTLLDGAKDKPELCTKYLERTNKAVERLNYIVTDLDLITRLEVGDLNLKKDVFDIIELIKNVFELLEMKASKKNISLTLDKHYPEPIYVCADQERIGQVVTNLVVNSIKYGNNDGTTEVSVENLVEEKLIVRVTDNGEGIEKDHIPRLFERFYRVSKSRSREEGGSGLGLSIVKHIIEAQNEQIYVESILGMGSEFSFTIQKANTIEA